MQADHAIPAALVTGAQILNEAGRFDALLVRHVRIGAQHF